MSAALEVPKEERVARFKAERADQRIKAEQADQRRGEALSAREASKLPGDVAATRRPDHAPKSITAEQGSAGANVIEAPALETSELLADVLTALERYVVFPDAAQVTAVALWILNTYVFDLWDTTPYLYVRSPTKQAGKSTLFDVLSMLVARPWKTDNPSSAVLFRKIAKDAPTLLFDETDATFGKDQKLIEEIRGIFNAGSRHGGTVSRCIGDKYEVQDFPVFCPKAFAGIGMTLPDTMADRSISIVLRRSAPSERQPGRFRYRDTLISNAPLCERITSWAAIARAMLDGARPALPEALSGRQQDFWEPLLAIADLAGGEWPVRTRAAAVKLHGGVADQDVSVLLLAHMRELFNAHNAVEMPTEDVLNGLINRGDDSPWAPTWSNAVERGDLRGPAGQLARKLKPYDIHPAQLWIDGDKTRGYRRSDLEDAWGRYLPSGSSATVLPPRQDGRTVGRRSEALLDKAQTGAEQDSTVLPSLSPHRATRADSAPLAKKRGDSRYVDVDPDDRAIWASVPQDER